MTSFVQPLDAGIIRCFKAYYRRAFCIQAVEKDEAGEEDIYKINLLEALLMAKQAWQEITSETIANCWRHAGILPSPPVTPPSEPAAAPPPSTDPSPSADTSSSSTDGSPPHPTCDKNAWDILRSFATGKISTLPAVIDALFTHLGDQYRDNDWKVAFDTILQAEEDDTDALAAIEKLCAATLQSQDSSESATAACATTNQPAEASGSLSLPQLESVEAALLCAVDDLKTRKRIRGTALTLEEMLNPVEEQVVGKDEFSFPGGDADIVTEVREAFNPPEVMEIDDSESEDDTAVEQPVATTADAIEMCKLMEKLCIAYPDVNGVDSLGLQSQIRRLRGHIHHENALTQKQTTLDTFFRAL